MTDEMVLGLAVAAFVGLVFFARNVVLLLTDRAKWEREQEPVERVGEADHVA